MHQRFIQSRRQFIVERGRLYFEHCLVLTLVTFLMNVLFGYTVQTSMFIYLPILAMVVISLWLIVFNSGSAKVIERGLILSDKGKCFIKFGQEQHILWQHFAGFELQGWPKTVVISSTKLGQEAITFSNNTFSPEQRRVIFEQLRFKQAQLTSQTQERPSKDQNTHNEHA
ncbi:hypothetical protein PULV_b0551 [Pseudoalteromonas ulvae UL12]|uniref:Uncharacterized protein n=1 Tax=Pseudoalteromonas ulvae TaxID=107327 RepID=A0A244CLT6_PSEDV|nr:hypothetical protein [Pseudoalteromonas ulvae]MBE0365863.1 hypothetical protein [Pseudoalteromonas ulvae UL12]OUL56554.1 hypothetical protein B1199_18005 [Pseudoalteromonas ulvae]